MELASPLLHDVPVGALDALRGRAQLVSEGRTTLQGRTRAGTIVIIVKKEVHNTSGTMEGASENTR